jgi:hypothetical protein
MTTLIPKSVESLWERLWWVLLRTFAGALSGLFSAWVLSLATGWNSLLLGLPLVGVILVNIFANDAATTGSSSEAG